MGKKIHTLFHEEDQENVVRRKDNMVWNGGESEIASWCRRNKVFDEITEEEIEEI